MLNATHLLAHIHDLFGALAAKGRAPLLDQYPTDIAALRIFGGIPAAALKASLAGGDAWNGLLA